MKFFGDRKKESTQSLQFRKERKWLLWASRGKWEVREASATPTRVKWARPPPLSRMCLLESAERIPSRCGLPALTYIRIIWRAFSNISSLHTHFLLQWVLEEAQKCAYPISSQVMLTLQVQGLHLENHSVGWDLHQVKKDEEEINDLALKKPEWVSYGLRVSNLPMFEPMRLTDHNFSLT